MHIMNLVRSDLEVYFIKQGEKSFKALQVFDWLYRKMEIDINSFTNLKQEVRFKLKSDFDFNLIKVVKKEEADLTQKYLFKLSDGNEIEAVLMKHDYGLTGCISTQVGCNLGCRFCASGRLKKIRNLEVYEMVEQVWLMQKDAQARISQVVLMGIGEPLDNLNNVFQFLQIVNDAHGLAIGSRHLTISTCGLVPQIYELAHFPLQVNLAVSLHAPNDELRNKLMSVNQVYNISKLLTAIKAYSAITHRRVTIEYVMLKGVNDSLALAHELVQLLKGLNIYVNLIPYNKTDDSSFESSSKEQILSFYDYLKKNKIQVTIRREFGQQISAACGQLRSKEVK